MNRVWILVLATLLAACSSQDESTHADSQDSQQTEAADSRSSDDGASAAEGTPIEELTADELAALARDPEVRREMMQDPERRAALRERMREMRQERMSDSERQERRQAMRERAERYRQSAGESEGGEMSRRGRRGQWWDNEAIAQKLDLSDEQTSRIGEAHAEMMEAARQARQQLAQAAGDLQDALVETDRDRLEELIEARVDALDARARAEAEWSRQLLEILSDEQMQKLAEERPGLTSTLLSPSR